MIVLPFLLKNRGIITRATIVAVTMAIKHAHLMTFSHTGHPRPTPIAIETGKEMSAPPWENVASVSSLSETDFKFS